MDGAAMPAAAVGQATAATAAFLRIAEAPDAVLTACAGSALALAEAFCGQWLVARGATAALSTGGGWQRLAALPVRAIAAPMGVSAEGAAFALPVGAYGIDIDAGGIGWVRLVAQGQAACAAGRVTVAYTAGLAADWTTLPAPLAQGVVLLAAHLFEHREGAAGPPAAVAALWRPYRRMRLQVEVRP